MLRAKSMIRAKCSPLLLLLLALQALCKILSFSASTTPIPFGPITRLLSHSRLSHCAELAYPRMATIFPSGGVLTDLTMPSTGALFSPQPLPLFSFAVLRDGCGRELYFRANFSFTMLRSGKTGGDGLAFVISKTAAAGTQGGMGFGGMDKASLAVEFDTWLNKEEKDASNNHVGVNVNRISISKVAVKSKPLLNSGMPYFVWVEYSPAGNGTLNVSLATSPMAKPAKPLLSTPLSLYDVLQPTEGSNSFYFGFVAASREKFTQQHTVGITSVETATGLLVSEATLRPATTSPFTCYVSAGYSPAQDEQASWTTRSYSVWSNTGQLWQAADQGFCEASPTSFGHLFCASISKAECHCHGRLVLTPYAACPRPRQELLSVCSGDECKGITHSFSLPLPLPSLPCTVPAIHPLLHAGSCWAYAVVASVEAAYGIASNLSLPFPLYEPPLPSAPLLHAGSCWAYAVVASVEAAYGIASNSSSGSYPSLSVSSLYSLMGLPSCSEGSPALAFKRLTEVAATSGGLEQAPPSKAPVRASAFPLATTLAVRPSLHPSRLSSPLKWQRPVAGWNRVPSPLSNPSEHRLRRSPRVIRYGTVRFMSMAAGTRSMGMAAGTRSMGMAAGTRSMGMAAGTRSMGMAAGTRSMGMAAGTRSMGMAAGTRSMVMGAGTRSMGMAAGTRSMGMAAGTRSMGMAAGTRSMGMAAGTRSMGMAAGTRSMGMAAGTRSMGMAARTRSMVMGAGTRSMGMAAGTRSMGMAAGTRSMGMAAGTRSMGMAAPSYTCTIKALEVCMQSRAHATTDLVVCAGREVRGE
ncbi:unnamed protein product [Closterium sp. Yama58-4]|nr:unnamed protein product [Closterium sp. Yama58-4]